MELSMITATIDPILKSDVESILRKLDLSVNDAVNLFFAQVKRCGTLPFETEIPNEKTRKAIDEARKGIGLVVCDNEDDMFEKLGNSRRRSSKHLCTLLRHRLFGD